MQAILQKTGRKQVTVKAQLDDGAVQSRRAAIALAAAVCIGFGATESVQAAGAPKSLTRTLEFMSVALLNTS